LYDRVWPLERLIEGVDLNVRYSSDR